jgi:hypothetical protein
MSIFPKKSKPAPSEIETRVSAVTAAETALEAARGVAAEAARLAAGQVAEGEKAVAEARERLKVAEAVEAARPLEERLASRRAEIVEIDLGLRAAVQWLSEEFAKRETAGTAISILTAKLGKREAPPRLSIDPHLALLSSSDARLEISWPKVALYRELR